MNGTKRKGNAERAEHLKNSVGRSGEEKGKREESKTRKFHQEGHFFLIYSFR